MYLLVLVLESRTVPTFHFLVFLVSQIAHLGVGGTSCSFNRAWHLAFI
jgi:hypothetical protein